MEDLKNIVKLIPYKNLDEFASKISSSLLGYKQKELFEAIKSDSEISINEITEKLGYSNNDHSLAKLSYRLKNQLLNGLFLFDLEDSSTTKRSRKFLALYKRFTIVKILQELEYNKSAINIAKTLIHETRKYQIFDITLILAELLENHYSFVSFDQTKSAKYERIYIESLNQIISIRKVSKLYYSLAKMILSGKNIYEEAELKSISIQVKELDNISSQELSFLYSERVYSIKYFYYLLIKEFDTLLNVALQAKDFFKSNQPDKLLPIFASELRISVAYLYQQNFSEARNYMLSLERFNATPGTLHWNSAKSYHFVLEMLTRNYQKAANIHTDTVTEKAIKKLDNMWIQQWNIRSAYIHFLAKIGLVDLEKLGKKRVPSFRLARFLNDVPLYSRDKRGYNISIIIAQFLILLADKKYEQIYDRIEALSKYSYRHLKNDYRLRSNCFIRMLLSLPRADFHPVRAQRYAKKYVDRLGTTELNLSEYSTEIEIIPYEDLWEIIIDLLSQRKIKNYKSSLIPTLE